MGCENPVEADGAWRMSANMRERAAITRDLGDLSLQKPQRLIEGDLQVPFGSDSLRHCLSFGQPWKFLEEMTQSSILSMVVRRIQSWLFQFLGGI